MSDAFPPPPPPPPSGSNPSPSGAWAQPVGQSANYASFGQRLGAVLVDWVALFIVGQVIAAAVGGLGAGLVQLLVGVAYISYLDGVRGQTLGKMAVGIRVIDQETGQPVGLGRGFVRYIGKIISALVVFVGYFWMLWDSDKQTWHDKMVRSLVVRN